MLYINKSNYGQGDIVEIKNTIYANIKAVVAIIGANELVRKYTDNTVDKVTTTVIILRDKDNNVYFGMTSDYTDEEYIGIVEIPSWSDACTNILNEPIVISQTKQTIL